VDATHLETTGTRDYVPADLGELAVMSCTLLFDTENATGMPAVGGAAAAIVLTYKQMPAQTAPANLTGVGYVSRVKWPDSNTNEVMVAEIDFQWTEAPTFTAATTV
jgi:hypothetical protein